MSGREVYWASLQGCGEGTVYAHNQEGKTVAMVVMTKPHHDKLEKVAEAAKTLPCLECIYYPPPCVECGLGWLYWAVWLVTFCRALADLDKECRG